MGIILRFRALVHRYCAARFAVMYAPGDGTKKGRQGSIGGNRYGHLAATLDDDPLAPVNLRIKRGDFSAYRISSNRSGVPNTTRLATGSSQLAASMNAQVGTIASALHRSETNLF